MTWPLVRNDRGAARRLGLSGFALAILVAWIAPFLLGIALYAIWAVATLGMADDQAIEPVAGFAIVLMMTPMFSWVGFLPGGGVLWLMLRRGWGGLISVLATGFAVGAVIGVLVGSGSPVSIFSITGLFGAGLAWITLRLLRPAALTPAT